MQNQTVQEEHHAPYANYIHYPAATIQTVDKSQKKRQRRANEEFLPSDNVCIKKKKFVFIFLQEDEANVSALQYGAYDQPFLHQDQQYSVAAQQQQLDLAAAAAAAHYQNQYVSQMLPSPQQLQEIEPMQHQPKRPRSSAYHQQQLPPYGNLSQSQPPMLPSIQHIYPQDQQQQLQQQQYQQQQYQQQQIQQQQYQQQQYQYNLPQQDGTHDEDEDGGSGGGGGADLIASGGGGEEDDDLSADDDEDESEQVPQTQDLVFALFDKVTRTKNKWKCSLKYGMMLLNGKDYVFNRANGEFEW